MEKYRVKLHFKSLVLPTHQLTIDRDGKEVQLNVFARDGSGDLLFNLQPCMKGLLKAVSRGLGYEGTNSLVPAIKMGFAVEPPDVLIGSRADLRKVLEVVALKGFQTEPELKAETVEYGPFLRKGIAAKGRPIIIRTEALLEPSIEFQVIITAKKLTEEVVRGLLEAGQYAGLGAQHTLGYGQFELQEFQHV